MCADGLGERFEGFFLKWLLAVLALLPCWQKLKEEHVRKAPLLYTLTFPLRALLIMFLKILEVSSHLDHPDKN